MALCQSVFLFLFVLAFPLRASTQETYTSEVFHVMLQYPSSWRCIEGSQDRYGGTDGFFQLSAMANQGWTIREVCELEAAQIPFTYGFFPQIEWWQVQGQEACLIWPSEDRDENVQRQAALIVSYPQPVHVGKDIYSHFILWADTHHIEEIAQTLRFTDPSPSPFNGPDPRHPKRLILKLRGVGEASEPAFHPDTHALEYIDQQLCFAVEVPVDWTSDGMPGAFASFGLKMQEQSLFNISQSGGSSTLADALEELRRGSLGPYIQGVEDFTVHGRPALWVTFLPAAIADEFRFVVLVISSDCGHGPRTLFIGAKPGVDREQFEAFLNHLRFLRSSAKAS